MFKRLKNMRFSRKPILKKVANYTDLLILVDDEDDALIQTIKVNFSGANITLLLPRLNKEAEDRAPYCSYHKSDFNLIEKIKSIKLNEVLSRTYDLVVDLSTDSKLNELVFKKIKGNFLIGGSHKLNADCYDLQIEKRICDNKEITVLKNHLTILSQHGN